MEYKKINKYSYLFIYTLLIVIVLLSQYLIYKYKEKETIRIEEERIQTILSNRKNQEITNNLSEYIGKVVNWHTQNDMTKDITWKLLYADEFNTYLISADYINKNKQLPKENSEEFDGTYTDNDYIVNFKYGDNSKVVKYLTNNELWKKLYNNNNDVDWVAGSPTMELYTKAHNCKYGTNFIAQKNNEGYIEPIKSYMMYQTISDDDTFVLKNSEKTKILWLAAEDGAGDAVEYLWAIDNNSQSFMTTCNYGGLRPVIALKSSVELEIMK